MAAPIETPPATAFYRQVIQQSRDISAMVWKFSLAMSPGSRVLP
jgi:hypothetical protein